MHTIVLRSIYFDDILNRCVQENASGIGRRKKYRIRMYGTETSPIHLEIKIKTNDLTKKDICSLTPLECKKLINGDYSFAFDNRSQLNQLLIQMKERGMQPKIIIAYERTAFVYPIGNVRVTFDSNIVACTKLESFITGKMQEKIPVLQKGMSILEVKYDELLPEIIAQQLEIGTLLQTAFSKYYLGRLAAEKAFCHK